MGFNGINTQVRNNTHGIHFFIEYQESGLRELFLVRKIKGCEIKKHLK
jgi:hypothetical protein